MTLSSNRQRGCAVRKTPLKELQGRGSRRQWWKNILHQVLRDTFNRLRVVGVKMTTALLRETAISLVQNDDATPLSQQEVEI